MSSDEILTPERVEDAFCGCLAGTGDDGPVTEGIMTSAVFDPARITDRREGIAGMLRRLPVQFRRSGGGGWSFLNACEDRDGSLWTGEHRTVEHLLMLGTAAGLVTLLMPRDLWEALPGGMPYYMVDVDDE